MKTTAELTIRSATSDDLGAILELMKASLGEGAIPRDRSYWDWKHRRNPFGESPVLLAEAAGGQLVGLRVFMRWEWHARGTRVRAVRAVDTATHPEWQGRGIFSRTTKAMISRMREEGVHLVFNTPNDKSRPGYLKMGWRAVGRTDLLIRPISPLRILANVGSIGSGSGTPTAEELPQSDHPDADGELQALEVGTGFARSLENTTMNPRLRVHRDLAYLRWRYAEVPGFRYHALSSIEGSEGALVIFRYKRQGSLRELRICDFLAGPGKRSRQLLRDLVRQLVRERGADYLSVMCHHRAREFGVWLGAGFVPAPGLGPLMTVLPLNPLPAGVDPLDRRGWQLSIGDLELF